MKESPILFSGPMVQAILEGRKTQTRRIVKKAKHPYGNWLTPDEVVDEFIGETGVVRSPYGHPGNMLWVKETFFAWGRWETRYSAKKGRNEWHFIDMTRECGKEYRYAADHVGDNGPRQRGGVTPQWWKRPAIFMPRWASRITLEITDVRVERLNDINDADAIAEGAEGFYVEDGWYWRDYRLSDEDAAVSPMLLSAKDSFSSLWKSINGTGVWEENPWVWAVSFRRVQP